MVDRAVIRNYAELSPSRSCSSEPYVFERKMVIYRSFLICNPSSTADSIRKCFLNSHLRLFSISPSIFSLRPTLNFSITSPCFFSATSNQTQFMQPIKTVHKDSPFQYLSVQAQPVYPLLWFRRFNSEATTNSTKRFEFSDSDDESDDEEQAKKNKKKEIDKSKLPPPYDPFSKKPVIEEPNDPKDLQEIFHKMRSEGLVNEAIKMFDALSKDGLTHEAMELFGQIKDKGNMPDVVAHTAVVEAYANAGQSKEAMKVYMRMLAAGVKPNAYTYTVLIKGLSKDGKLGDAKKYIMEMMDRGIRPNAGTYTTLFESFCREEKMDEAREFLEQMKAKGFVPDEKATREHLNKRGQVFRSVMNVLFGK